MRSKQKTPQKLPRHYRGYSDDDLLKAYEAAKSGEMSIRKAAKLFKVPASTIRDRINGIVKHGNMRNRDTLLTREEEMALLEYLEASAYLGWPYGCTKLKEIGGLLVGALGKKDSDKPMSNSWMTFYIKRWEKRIKSIRTIDPKSVDENTVNEKVRQCLENMKQLAADSDDQCEKDREELQMTVQWLETRIKQLEQLPVSKKKTSRKIAKEAAASGETESDDAMLTDSSDDDGEESVEDGEQTNRVSRKYCRYHKYDDDDLQKAYKAAKSRKMSIRRAAKVFNVPASTIRDRVNGVVVDGIQRKTLFIQETEIALIEYFEVLAYLGYTNVITCSKLKETGGQVANALKKKKSESPLSNSWMSCFMKRWEESIKSIRSISPISVDGDTVIEKVGKSEEKMEKLVKGAKGKVGYTQRDKRELNMTMKWFKTRLEDLTQTGQLQVVSSIDTTDQRKMKTKIEPKQETFASEEMESQSSSSDDDAMVTDSSDDDGLEYEEDAEVCCVCEEFTPPDIDSQPYVKLIKWAYCDKCSHCVHLAFCHAKRAVRKADTFLCPHCV